MSQIKFGTDGWRAIIAESFSVDNVKRVADATALWIKKHHSDNPSVVIGHDCRFGGDLFAKTAARVFAHYNIHAFLAEGISTTPMVSLGVKEYKASAGVVITASHNPAEYNGFKIKAYYGGPAVPTMISEVESYIPDHYRSTLKNLEDYVEEDRVSFVDLESLYIDHAKRHFDLEAINNSGLKLAYDPMFGAGLHVLKKMLPNVTVIHDSINPSFNHTAPEPIMKNLGEFSELIKNGTYDSGLATDGDADRIGLLDNEGNFVDSHHIILMLIKYLHEYKNYKGEVITSFSCTSKIKSLCEQMGLPHETTKIGFKYICDLIVNKYNDFLLGGEESGGISIAGHIPERDGIWIGLTIWEYMAKSGKSLKSLIDEVYDSVGSFWVDRYDLHINEELKQTVMEACANNAYSSFGDYQVQNIENLDGYKFHIGDEKWVMIRPSGTEPVLRVYAQGANKEEVIKILDSTKNAILGK